MSDFDSDLASLVQENAVLKTSVVELTRENRQLRETARENEEELERLRLSIKRDSFVGESSAPKRVRLRTQHFLVGEQIGTVVDVARKGIVVDWPSGIRNYVSLDALEPLEN